MLTLALVALLQPEIDEVFPPAAAPGCAVAILGSGLAPDPQVAFNGVNAEVLYSDPWLVLAVVPGPGPVTVTVDGETSNAAPFEALSAAGPPVLSTIEPPSAPVGAIVLLTGENLGDYWCLDEVQVTFGGVASPWVVPIDGTMLFAVVPEGSGTVPVVVTVDGQSSNAVDFTIEAAPSAPVLASIDPDQGPPGTLVTLAGSGFVDYYRFPTVWFGDSEIGVLYATPDTIVTLVPPGSGTVAVRVRVYQWPTFASSDSNSLSFTITGSSGGTPNITSVESGACNGEPGTYLTLHGSGFLGVVPPTVIVNGQPAWLAFWADNEIYAFVPETLNSGSVYVIVDGQQSNTASFTTEFVDCPGGP